MIPDIARTGSSFKGALAYYLHDKKRAGERERLSSDRVAWTETRNLATRDPELAGRVMAATAIDADRLKHAAGVRNTGRKSAQTVYAYTLAWHPEEAKTLTRAEMVRAADETLRVLGAQDRQAILVCHTDRPHPHVHIILNRVSPQDGRMLLNGNDRLKLSQWALGYDQMRGQGRYCPQRAENWDIRLSRHKDRGKLQYRRAAADTPRSMADDVRVAKEAGDPKTADVIAAQKKRLAKLAADGQSMTTRPCKPNGKSWASASRTGRPASTGRPSLGLTMPYSASRPRIAPNGRISAAGNRPNGAGSRSANSGFRVKSAMRSRPCSMPGSSIPTARAAFWEMPSTISPARSSVPTCWTGCTRRRCGN